MRYGFVIPDIQGVSANDFAGMAREAEASGWDAIFFWDGDWGLSPWITLSAMAVATERVRLGAILHPLAWRQPWLFARDSATLDQLSNGRLIITIGLGAIDEQDVARGRTRFGEPVDRKIRAQLMDEGLEIINGLWSGQPVTFHGEHWQMDEFRCVRSRYKRRAFRSGQSEYGASVSRWTVSSAAMGCWCIRGRRTTILSRSRRLPQSNAPCAAHSTW